MNDRDLLIQEIKDLLDFLIDQVLGIVLYIKIGIEYEYISSSDNAFYNNDEFRAHLFEAMSQYRRKKI